VVLQRTSLQRSNGHRQGGQTRIIRRRTIRILIDPTMVETLISTNVDPFPP
jgi:hypothetical protein